MDGYTGGQSPHLRPLLNPLIQEQAGGTLSPEFLWALGVSLLLILAVVTVSLRIFFGRLREFQELTQSITSAPRASEFDFDLSPLQRSEELYWIEGLMAAPAYGEPDGSERGTASSS